MRSRAAAALLMLRLSARSRAAAPPRWRARSLVAFGVGGGRDHDNPIALFPITLEIGARLWGPLSVDAAAQVIQTGEYYVACGEGRRPSAVLGSAGVRADLGNTQAASWLDPFVELHLGGGIQGGGPELAGSSPDARGFVSGGARLGFDVWLGEVALTLVGSFDYLPTASPLALSIGLSFVIF